MKTALVPGSFDPPTKGHLSVIETASKLFDTVLVTVMENPEKNYCFSSRERVDMLCRITEHLKNVRVSYHSGMLWEYAVENRVDVIIKGVRGKADLDYETVMAEYNKKHSGADTLLVAAYGDNAAISSSLVRKTALCGGDIGKLVPAEIAEDILKKYR